MIYNVEKNDDIVTLQIPVSNNDLLTNATGVLATQTFPAGISIYGTPVMTQGSYNTLTKIWTIGTLTPNNTPTGTAVLTIKIKVDDISLQPFNIKTVVTITEPEQSLLNNTRWDTIRLGTCVNCGLCDPCNFEEPILISTNDTSGLTVNLAENDVINCDCCQKEFEIVGSPVNITVNSISVTGILKYSFIDPTVAGSLSYRIKCKNCPNGLDYLSNTSTVTFSPIVSSFDTSFTVKTTQTTNYTQEANFDYFRFNTASSTITFTLLPVTNWVIGKKVTLYVYDASQSGPLVNNFIISTSTGTETFTDTNTQTKTYTSNYTSFTVVYVGSNKFDII